MNEVMNVWYSKNPLYLHRISKKLTREKLADQVEVSTQAIYYWERGERLPGVMMFMKLAKVLGGNIISEWMKWLEGRPNI